MFLFPMMFLVFKRSLRYSDVYSPPQQTDDIRLEFRHD
ncbi:hypothetical protein NOC27_3338 [Nitrosococcus oceani AFC27]|nr:hypothetical protein NOC27_3338 [Nitrosococcus oceani AFC27]